MNASRWKLTATILLAALLFSIPASAMPTPNYLLVVSQDVYINYYHLGIGPNPSALPATYNEFFRINYNQGMNIMYTHTGQFSANPGLGLYGSGQGWLWSTSFPLTTAQMSWIKNNYPSVRLIIAVGTDVQLAQILGTGTAGAFWYPIYQSYLMSLTPGLPYDPVNYRPVIMLAASYAQSQHVTLHEWGHTMGRDHQCNGYLQGGLGNNNYWLSGDITFINSIIQQKF